MQFAVGDLVRHKRDGSRAEIVEPIPVQGLLIRVNLESGSVQDWARDMIDLDWPATIARERKRLAEDITKATQAGLLPAGWSLKEALGQGLPANFNCRCVLTPKDSSKQKQAEGGNVSSGVDPGDAKNPSESHNFAVHTTFDPALESGGFGKQSARLFEEAIDPELISTDSPIFPKFSIRSFVRWTGNSTKWRVMDHNEKGYRLEAAEGTFRDSWSKVPENVLSPWEEPGNPPSRVPIDAVQKPVEVACVLDEESDEAIYVDGELQLQDNGLFEIGEVIGKKTCTIESLRVVLGGEDWPYTFDPSWREPKPEAPITEYREPTQADLANGPIECEVTDHETFVGGILLAAIATTEYPFITIIDDEENLIGWKHCRIKTVSPTDSQ